MELAYLAIGIFIFLALLVGFCLWANHNVMKTLVIPQNEKRFNKGLCPNCNVPWGPSLLEKPRTYYNVPGRGKTDVYFSDGFVVHYCPQCDKRITLNTKLNKSMIEKYGFIDSETQQYYDGDADLDKHYKKYGTYANYGNIDHD